MSTPRSITLTDAEVRTLREAGRVTVRRVVETQPPADAEDVGPNSYEGDEGPAWFWWRRTADGHLQFWPPTIRDGVSPIHCPYGRPGDVLAVREHLWISECGRYFARRALPTPGNSMPLYDVLARDGSAVWHYGQGRNGDLKMAATSWSNQGREIGRGDKRRWKTAFEVGFIDDFDPTKTPEYPYGRSIGRKSATFIKRFPSTATPRWAVRYRPTLATVAVVRGDGGEWKWEMTLEMHA